MFIIFSWVEITPEVLERIGGWVAAVAIGAHAVWVSKKTNRLENKVDASASDTHQTKVVVVGEGDHEEGGNLKKMLSDHVESNDLRFSLLRSTLDEIFGRIGKVEATAEKLETTAKVNADKIVELVQRTTAVEGGVNKLEHSSSRHSEQINMLIDKLFEVFKPTLRVDNTKKE